MDISNGIIKIDDGLVVMPNFTFQQFKKTRFYDNQDGIRIIYLAGQKIIENRKYIVGLFFRKGKLYMISLVCCDQKYSENDEYKRKYLHDTVLHEFGLWGNSKFKWGEIESVYDARSNVSSINIIYY